MYRSYFKRIFDIIVCCVLLFFFSPIMIILFFLIWFKIGYPIFTQKRPGLHGKIFTIYKFKTLYDANSSVPEKKRQNNLGNFLRKTGLDELPQLINILQNKMSLIGPRPLLEEYLNRYSEYENQRHLVKPGITGLAQVSKNYLGKKLWKRNLRLDIFYVKKVNFFLDLIIVYNTFKIILFSKKIYKDFKKY